MIVLPAYGYDFIGLTLKLCFNLQNISQAQFILNIRANIDLRFHSSYYEVKGAGDECSKRPRESSTDYTLNRRNTTIVTTCPSFTLNKMINSQTCAVHSPLIPKCRNKSFLKSSQSIILNRNRSTEIQVSMHTIYFLNQSLLQLRQRRHVWHSYNEQCSLILLNEVLPICIQK